MTANTFKRWIGKVFIRDLGVSRVAFLYLFTSLFAIFLPLEVLVFKYGVFNEALTLDLKLIVIVVSLAISFVIAGSLVDHFKNKYQYYNIFLLVCTTGLILSNFTDTILDYIGLACITFSLPQMIVVWFTTLVHETTILNRGRITAFLLVSAFLLGLMGVIFAYSEFLYNFVFIVEVVVFVTLYVISKRYKYVETEERLQSDKKLREIIFEKHTFRYLSSLGVLSFILGNTVVRYTLALDILTLAIVSFFILILGGGLLDNVGRKFSLVGSALILSFLVIFSGLFGEDYVLGLPGPIFLSILYGVSVPPVFLFLITLSGDFSTDRGHLKYRGRINGLFTLVWFACLISGIAFHIGFMSFYELAPDIYAWIPDLLDKINAFLLVIVLIWMMAMREVFSSRDVEWANTIKTLYVFNYDGVCIYTQSFKQKILKTGMSEDLVSGGLTGIISLISEITENKKRLRIINQEGVKIYFNYGKYHIAALISTNYLPVLFKKLDAFSRAFERKFSDELENFHGRINPFYSTKYIVNKYFTERYTLFTE